MNDIQAPWVGMTPEEFRKWGNPYYEEEDEELEEWDEGEENDEEPTNDNDNKRRQDSTDNR